MIKNKYKSAFSLAEVLVAMTVLGVIAALTMPSVQQYSQTQANATLAKKAYSTLANATKAIKAENGPIRSWDLSNDLKAVDLYKSKINLMAPPPSRYPIYCLNGEDCRYKTEKLFAPYVAFVSGDGMIFALNSSSSSCQGGDGTLWKGCIDWLVDVNGPKGPNKVGRDIFRFYVNPEGVFPAGTVKGQVNLDDCNKASIGWSCSTRIINEGKMSW